MKNSPRYILILLVCIVSLQARFVSQHGQLQVKGIQLCDEKGKPVILRGMSYGWHNWWPRFYNAGSVKWLAEDWGCTVLRAAMGVEPANGYIKNPEWSVEKIKSVVKAAIKEDIYVIIDWHSHNIDEQEAVTFFTEMAKTYGDKPNVIYEIFNEPDEETWEDIKEYSVTVMKAIRSVDPDNIILVGSGHWDQDVNIVADDPITGFNNIMYTLHFYAATHKGWLRERADYALQKGIPLFVSESAGMKADGDGSIDYDEWNKWIDWMEKNKISWIIWSIADKNETCSVLTQKAVSDGGWSTGDLKESGQKSRALIRKYNLNEYIPELPVNIKMKK